MVTKNYILTIDDDPDIREFMTLMLEIEGHDSHAVANGKEALDFLSKNGAPALILLDLMMPIMNGWEFAEELKKHQNFSNIPIIILSAFSEKAKNIDNATLILNKPVETKTLMNHINELYKKVT